ncbi:MAG: arginine--tRNA ligase, partial [Pseudomonadales bacterium]|nr:arginine--tRNA ligase [Pseudomonadales bacterium]
MQEIAKIEAYGIKTTSSGKTIMVEYSQPNTNKPLHLGHLRNNMLGYSLANILKANGHKVIKANIINDRGIHICKSMLAWLRWGNGETPESSGLKGDHLVGKYYVEFNTHYKEEIKTLVDDGKSQEEAEKTAPLIIEAQDMLKKWEAGDESTISTWKELNSWVLGGFDESYKKLGVDFDEVYYESNTYLLGKEHVATGLGKGYFYKKDDGSVWCDLEEAKLDPKLLLRSDGTSVYMTQDLGTAVKRFEDYKLDQQIYVVGNEQNHHFNVLFSILKKMGYEWADSNYHLSYGMVELPSGKMKSREGTVVDADDIMDEMVATAKKLSLELGKLEGMPKDEQEKLFESIG